MIELLKYFDIFSQPIQFNGDSSQKKKTSLGITLSFFIFVSTLFYFTYLSQLYFSNQIDPKFRSQNFVTNDVVNITLSDDTFGFQLAPQFGQNLIQEQDSKNKTYIVFLAFYQQRNSSTFKSQQLDVVKCQNPELEGFYCIDFSRAPNLNITISHRKSLFSELIIYPYRCQDTDNLKQFVPDNCADPYEIESYLSSLHNTLNFKIQVSQINITSKQVEVSYVNNRLPALGNFITLAELKMKKQITSVKEGFFIQSESIFSSPITAQFASSSLDYKSYVKQTGQKMISIVVVDADENVEYSFVQYPPYTEVLALCNSFFSLLMILGVICKMAALRIIRQDIFLLFLQNTYLETYQKILKNCKLIEFKNDIQPIQRSKSIFLDENEATESDQKIQIPIFKELKSLSVFKQGFSIDQKQGSSPQQNLSILDNQSSISQSNVLFQTNLDQSDIKNKINRDSPLLNVKKNILKRNFINQSQNQKVKKLQDNSFYQKSQSQNLKQELVEDANKNNTYIHTIKQMLLSFQNNSIKHKVQNLLFKTRLFSRNKFLESQGLNKQMVEKIEKEVLSSQDFYKVYKDILFLKKAIMILFSKDQLAALKLVGYSHEFLGFNLDREINQTLLNDRFQKSYLEQQFVIQQYEELQSQQVNLFLQRYQKQQNLSQIDKRIYSSMCINQIV
ncbi:AMP-binding enzyme family protein, putative (macronuclear) [Tetrahymena thermophila SB210]|uniref:AMP-binding enzyme family protein, putative n=1 Tax=Tetrahymena thermophila (strain SB210) TaxID=312017 RepID=Q22BZ6_TETTS|nr:AMP-binding enzyme family protein, putative [Tetrahymena thermophila SB210]EAR82813.2 AMP-binding enzyme family protein, putative [Tetrahymena thermophila SB210]|eukprot:XP_001030476.2 AMP-binding enzyme family protein, putative [Tetrahymena thermophila SB210]